MEGTVPSSLGVAGITANWGLVRVEQLSRAGELFIEGACIYIK